MVSLCDLYLCKCCIAASFLPFLVHMLVTENLKLHRIPTQTFIKLKLIFRQT